MTMQTNNLNGNALTADSGIMTEHKFPWKWNLTDLANVKKNGCTVFSCFSCGGGSSMGYKLAGYELLGNCEIDSSVMKVYQANHHPKYPFLMDIRDFLDKEKPEELYNLDILDGSPPCFGTGTMVKVIDGYKPIEEIQVGDYVFTHKGRYRKVNAVMSKFAQNVCTVKIHGTLPITVTKNHPFLAKTMFRTGKQQSRQFTKEKWMAVKDFEITKNSSGSTKQQTYLAFPINLNQNIPDWDGVIYTHNICGKSSILEHKHDIDVTVPAFWYFIGRWIGDGWRRKDRKVVFIADGKNKYEELLSVIQNAGFNPITTEQKTTYRFEINNSELWEFVKQFGDGASNKRIPDFVLNLPDDLLKQFLEGYLSADGNCNKRDDKWRCSSVSLQLILGLQAVIGKIYKQATTITTKDNTGHLIEGRSVNCQLAYDLAFFKQRRKQQHFYEDNNYLWVPFRWIKDAEPQTVYNLSVDEDESYTVYNIAVHNCSVFSQAGKREEGWNVEKQFREGQKMQRLDDLFFWFIKLIDQLKPKVSIAENVTGLLAGNAKGYVNEIIKAYHEAGYTVQLFKLNAAKMGVPQRRERVFFIAHRNDIDLPKLQLSFNEPPILFKEIRSESGKEWANENAISKMRLMVRKPGDKDISSIMKNNNQKETSFQYGVIADNDVAPTLAASGSMARMYDGKNISDMDIIHMQTFPEDYNFLNQSPKYICGMSVPPVMMAQISSQVYDQWLRRLK